MYSDKQVFFSNFNQQANQTISNELKPHGVVTGSSSYHDTIIPAPDRNITHKSISKPYVIDSGRRNVDLFPEPYNYDFPLDDRYRDVISVEMTYGKFPNTVYLINNSNNVIHIQEELNQTVEVVIDVGNYTISELLTKIETKLSNLLSSGDLKNSYSLSYDTNTNIVTWSVTYSNSITTPIFTLIFLEPECNYNKNREGKRYCQKSMGRILGYKADNHVSTKEGIVTGTSGSDVLTGFDTKFLTDLSIGDEIVIQGDVTTTYEVDEIIDNTTLTLTGDLSSDYSGKMYAVNYLKANNVYDLNPDSYFIIDIPDLDVMESASDPIDDTFAVIFVDTDADFTTFNANSCPTQRVIKYFNPPLGSLDRLRIRFRRYDGSEYDFNGREHVMQFNITQLNQSGKYNDANSGTILN